MTALIIGGCGFIGSHIVDALLARGHDVRVLDRKAESTRAPLSNVDYRFGDFSDKMTLVEAMIGVEMVFHVASTTFPGTADLDPKIDISENLVGTVVILDTMVQLGIRRILFLSSGGTVYGVPERLPVPEDHPLRPIGSYGIVKVAIEQYLAMYARLHGLLPLIVRAANPYGPRQGHSGVQGVISTFLGRILDDRPVQVWGDGNIVRDYLHVADLAKLCAIGAERAVTGAFNAGSGAGYSLNDIIHIVQHATKRRVQIEHLPARSVDVPRSVLDVSKAAEIFGWRCEISVEQGIESYWKWLTDAKQCD